MISFVLELIRHVQVVYNLRGELHIFRFDHGCEHGGDEVEHRFDRAPIHDIHLNIKLGPLLEHLDSQHVIDESLGKDKMEDHHFELIAHCAHLFLVWPSVIDL